MSLLLQHMIHVVRYCLPTMLAFIVCLTIGRVTRVNGQFIHPELLEMYDNTTDDGLLSWFNVPFVRQWLPHLKEYKMYKAVTWYSRSFVLLLGAIVSSHGYAQETIAIVLTATALLAFALVGISIVSKSIQTRPYP